jgi:hypothetical protein
MDFDVSFYDCYAAYDAALIPAPLRTIHLLNTPAGSSAGGMGCWVVTIDQYQLDGQIPTCGGYWFGGYSASTPFSAFYMSIQGDQWTGPPEGTTNSLYLWGTDFCARPAICNALRFN